MSFRPPRFQPTPSSKPIKDFFSASNGFNSYYQFDIVQTPRYRRGLWALSNPRRANLNRKNMTIVQFKRWLTLMFLDKRYDASILDTIKKLALPYFPVRSGRLYDTFANTLRIGRAKWYNTHLLLNVSYEWDRNRPFPILGHVQHALHLNQLGIAKYYNPRHTIPNVHLIQRIGNLGVYWLDDPYSYNNPVPSVNSIVEQKLEQDLKMRYDQLIFTLQI